MFLIDSILSGIVFLISFMDFSLLMCRLPFQWDLFTDVPVRSAQRAIEYKGSEIRAQTKGPQVIEMVCYSRLPFRFFSLASTLYSEFNFYTWASSGNLTPNVREDYI